MNLNKIDAIVLRAVNYQEDHVLLVCLTENLGKIIVVASHARNLKSRLRSFSQAVVHGTIAVQAPRSGSNYYVLQQAQILDSFAAIKSDPYKLGSAGYIVSMIDQMIVGEQADPITYHLLAGFLKALANLTTDQQVTYLHAAIILRVLRAAGYNVYPQNCYHCNEPLQDQWHVGPHGNMYCQECLPHGKAIGRQIIRQWQLLLQELNGGEWPIIDLDVVMAIERFAVSLLEFEPTGQKYLDLIRNY